MNVCNSSADNVFGPQVAACRDGFDFTLLFEQSILSATPSVIATVACGVYFCYLSRKSVKTSGAPLNLRLRTIKQVLLQFFVLSQLSLVLLWAHVSDAPTTWSIIAALLSALAGVFLSVVSYVEHVRSVRPSAILNLYFAFSILLDMAQARTLLLRRENGAVSAVYILGMVFKIFILTCEMFEKRSFLRPPYSLYPPEALSGVLNRSVFWWINSLLIKGSSTRLRLQDLFGLDRKLSAEYIEPRIRKNWESRARRDKHGLLWACLQSFRFKLATIVFFRLILIAFKFSQPLLIHRAVSLLQEPDSQEKANIGRALIGATALIYIGLAIVKAAFRHNVYRLITMMRSALVSIIYDATLHLDSRVANESAALTLMSTDIETVAEGLEVFDSLWADPIEFVLASYMLYRQIGVSFVAAIITCLICVSIPIALRRVAASAQKAWLESIERRVATSASVLSNIKGVKMNGITTPVAQKLHDLRVTELKVSGQFRRVLGFTVTIGTVSHVTIPVVTLITYVLVMRANGGIRLTPEIAFTALSLVSLLTYPVQGVALGAPRLAAGVECFQRIQRYANSSRRPNISSTSLGRDQSPEDDLELRALPSSHHLSPTEDLLSVKNATFAIHDTTEPVLRDISLSLRPGKWTVLTGPVGCGKSVLLMALLGELELRRGTLDRRPSLDIGFCAQDPWLPNLSIRQIIASYTDFDETWYTTVVDACVLQRDLNELPAGDSTVIGSNGVSLSGGQKQRISLARALYSRKPLLILDDVLSGLDATTEKAIVERVFGRNGLVQRHAISVLLATHSVRHIHQADHAIIMDKGGVILEQGPPQRLENVTQQDSLASKHRVASEPHPSNASQHRGHPSATADTESHELQNELARRTGDIRLYTYYFKALGWGTTSALSAILLAYSVFHRFPTLWVEWWSEAEQKDPGLYTNKYAGVYGLFCCLCFIAFSIGIAILFQAGIPRSSIMLHSILLEAVMNAPYWFFVSTDSGEMVNMFSQDMSLLCLQLPFAFSDTLFNVGVCIVGSVLITMSSKWSLTIYPALIAILYVLQKFYLRTSRQMRLLDLEAKAPLYSNFMETLRGVVTIKAFGWQKRAAEANAELLDTSQRPFYLMYCIQRWLNLVLDLLVAGVAVLIVTLATQLKDSSAGALGVSLLNILTFSQDMTYLIFTWTQLETSLGAIARVKGFAAGSPSEHKAEETTEPPPEWPTKGRIEFQRLYSTYREGKENVLKDISLDIYPGSKIGICGRTGSGKSTLILSLLRLSEIAEGDIVIDGLSLTRMPRDTIRRRCNVVPQDPLILPGTIRFNADPLEQHSDDDIISALQDVGVWEILATYGGLDTDMDNVTLSRGQQQLFCLTRAVLSKARIVILDEVTSSVDAETEAKMMELVKTKFNDKTVLAVAHHLHTIREFDQIVVLDEGKVVETGPPGAILEQDGVFRELWERQH